jgi:DNA-binding Lrp family transcriptional regulator
MTQVHICYNLELKDNAGLSIEALSKELNLSQTIVKQRMTFWVHKMVIRESRVFINKGLQLRRMNSYEN